MITLTIVQINYNKNNVVLKGITNNNKMPYVGKNSHLKILIRQDILKMHLNCQTIHIWILQVFTKTTMNKIILQNVVSY
jgi:hypothetical protein